MIYLLAHMQYKENYGAHNWDGQGECPQHWKFKFGPAIIIARMTPKQSIETSKPEMANWVNVVIRENELAWDNPASKQYLLKWELIGAKDIHIIWDNAKDPHGHDVQSFIGATGYNYIGSIEGIDKRHGYYFKIDHDALRRKADSEMSALEEFEGTEKPYRGFLGGA